MKKLGVLIFVVVVWTVSGYAFGLGGGAIGFFAPMNNSNSLIDSFAADNGLALSGLHVGWGVDLRSSFFQFMDAGDIGLGIRYLRTGARSRDISVGASLTGLYAWGGFQMGRWSFGIDLGGYRGSFSFPAARYENLVGWSGGLTGSVDYEFIATDHFSLRPVLSLQWLPVDEMHDTAGQRYRGRGAPFLDFSGVSVSIVLTWSF